MPDALPTIPPSNIAQLTLRSYAALPKNLKPTVRSNGVPEWTILASIVLSLPILPVPAAVSTLTPQHDLRLISLGTGVKCLPTNRLPPCGDTLHDSHAEVLAKRGLGRYLAEEAIALSNGGESEVLEAISEHQEDAFRLRMRKGVGVHLYVSALPVRSTFMRQD
jgi:tRNA-specific adenosine deaminase 1